MASLKARHLPFFLALLLVLAYNTFAQSSEKTGAGIDVSSLGTAEMEEQIQVLPSQATHHHPY